MQSLFLSTFTNKVDNKGRVSVPSSFRSILLEQGFAGVIVYSSLINNCLECCSMGQMGLLYDMISKLDPFSLQRDALETYILGSSLQLSFDGEGRILLSEDLRNVCGITDKASFVGKGSVFEVWNPSDLQKHMLDARKTAIESKFLLGRALPHKHRTEKETIVVDSANCSHKIVPGQLKDQHCKIHGSCCSNAVRAQLYECGHIGTENAHSQNGHFNNTCIVVPSANEHSKLVHNVNSCYAEQEGQFVCNNKIALKCSYYNLPEYIAVTVGSVSFCFRGIDE